MCARAAEQIVDEPRRLEEVKRYRIVDTPPEKVFDDLAQLASLQFRMPVALISIVGERYNFFKATVGTSLSQMDRDISFCSHCILAEGGLVIPDARKDERFKSNPLVTGEHSVRFYAGFPLMTSSGIKLGTFCVLDRAPHHNFDAAEQASLEKYAAIASQLIEERLVPFALEEVERKNVVLEARSKQQAAASRAKTDFISNVSHEIRTPMNGVLGMLQLLSSTPLNEEQRHYVEVAQSSGGTLLALLDDLLDLQKIEAGKTTIESFCFDLFKTLDDVVEMWRIQSKTKGLSFSLSVSPRVPAKLVGDPGRIRQILNNLLSNALKFTHEGGLQLRVDSLTLSASAAELRFAVIDSGIGISPDRAKELFQPFVQADHSTTRKYGGTGLGLFISKRLVELMKGEMGVSSAEGEGSTVSFTISFGRQSTQGSDNREDVACFDQRLMKGASNADRLLLPTTPVEGISVNFSTTGRRQGVILVAEDNPTNQFVAQAQLSKMGYDVVLVGDGEAAVKAVQQQSFNVILMDCEMPNVDGFEATRRIREEGHKTPIIAVTAHAMAGNREACIQAGMDYYLSKPLDMRRLSRTLETWCQPMQASPVIEASALQTPSDHRKVFDSSALLERLMDDKVLAQKVVNAFIRDVPRQLDILAACASKSDNDGLRSQAHALKGAAASVSAETVREIAEELETSAQVPGVYICLESRLKSAYEQFCLQMDDIGWAQGAEN